MTYSKHGTPRNCNLHRDMTWNSGKIRCNYQIFAKSYDGTQNCCEITEVFESFVELKINYFKTFENKGISLKKTKQYDTNSRIKKPNKRQIDYRITLAVKLSLREKIRVEGFLPVVNSIKTALSQYMEYMKYFIKYLDF